MFVIVDLCVVPIGVGVSVSNYVAACERVLEEAGLSYSMHAYGTNIEGEWEAVFAAIYLDQGFEVAKRAILDLYRKPLEQVVADGSVKDPKTRLQERLQADKRPLPVYEVKKISGIQHDQSFMVLPQQHKERGLFH